MIKRPVLSTFSLNRFAAVPGLRDGDPLTYLLPPHGIVKSLLPYQQIMCTLLNYLPFLQEHISGRHA